MKILIDYYTPQFEFTVEEQNNTEFPYKVECWELGISINCWSIDHAKIEIGYRIKEKLLKSIEQND